MSLIAYIFVFAAVLSVILVLYILDVNIKKLQKNPEHFIEIHKQFLISIAISKVPPSLIIVFGIVSMPPDTRIGALIIPWIIIGITVIYGLKRVSNKKKEPVEKEVIYGRDTLITFTRPLLVTIPIMASAFLYLMTF